MKRLKTASIDLTYNCNFRCLHCFNSSGEHSDKRKELTDDEILKVAMDIAKMEPDSMCLCGGETMLRKDLILKVCSKIKKSVYKSVQISTVSNGYLIDEEVAEDLSKSGLDLIQISLDGATALSHDWLRNKEGSFEKALNAISLLKKAGLKVAVAFTPTKKNINELESAIDLAFNLGATFFRIQPTMSLGRARANLQDYLLNYFDYLDIKFILDKKRKQYSSSTLYTLEWGDPLDHLQYGMKETNLLYIISVGAYGDIMLTPYLPFVFGNVRDHSVIEYIDGGLKEAWNNPVIRNIVSKINSVDEMDTSLYGLPEIFSGENINLDILSPDYKNSTEMILNTFK